MNLLNYFFSFIYFAHKKYIIRKLNIISYKWAWDLLEIINHLSKILLFISFIFVNAFDSCSTLFNREFKWSTCPSGYYLSGFYRSNGNKLYDITHAWCCKPSGAPESYKTCYDEDVLIKFDWHQMEMVSCDRSGYYITGLYKSDCNQLHCIERFRCCELQIAGTGIHIAYQLINILCTFLRQLYTL